MEKFMVPDLSLLIAVRGRENQVHSVLQIISGLPQFENGSLEVILVELSGDPLFADYASELGIMYINLPEDGIFHKSKALNIALRAAKGRLVAPYDIDLVPDKGVIELLCSLALESPSLLIAGYRLMSPLSEAASISEVAASQIYTATENQPSALYKHLVNGERFGVVPAFKSEVLRRINGWDETFIGWGGEDQDIIERYLAEGHTLALCPDLVYFHLDHERDSDWSEQSHVEKNRKYYSTERATV